MSADMFNFNEKIKNAFEAHINLEDKINNNKF